MKLQVPIFVLDIVYDLRLRLVPRRLESLYKSMLLLSIILRAPFIQLVILYNNIPIPILIGIEYRISGVLGGLLGCVSTY